MIKIGAFVKPVESKNNSPSAIVVYDHSAHGHSDSLTIKWLDDGGLSLRKPNQIIELTKLEFCKEWCKDEISYM